MENNEQKPKPEESGIDRSKHNTADCAEKLRTLLSIRYIICLLKFNTENGNTATLRILFLNGNNQFCFSRSVWPHQDFISNPLRCKDETKTDCFSH